MSKITRGTEDYLEAIYEIKKHQEKVGTNKLANKLNVKPPSVSEMLRKLDEQGLVNYTKYKKITLTEKGKKLAKEIKETHEAIKNFLEIIQVPQKIAEKDACKAEHGLSSETVEQLKKFSKFIKKCPKNQPEWVTHFKHYSKHKEHPDECCY